MPRSRSLLLAPAVLAPSAGVFEGVSPELVEVARAEFAQRTGGATYRSPLPEDREPPLPRNRGTSR